MNDYVIERLGEHSLANADCIAVMQDIADNSIDLILADLPYGTTANKWDSVIDLDALWSAYLRITKPISAIALTASQPFTARLVMSQPKLFKHEWVWIKNRGSNFANTVREPMKEHESVLIFSKAKWTYNKQMQPRTGGGLDRVNYAISHETHSENYGNIAAQHGQLSDLRVPASWQKFNTQVGLHPTQKPVELMRYLIRTYTNPGDIVLDNTMGSGTTGVAAAMEGRIFKGIEQDPAYFAKARERLAAHVACAA